MSIPRIIDRTTNENIENMERYIREELTSVLRAKEKEKCQQLTDAEKICIFGDKYASNAEKFMFVEGERILIQDIAANVKQKLETVGDVDYFEQHSSARRTKNFKPRKTIRTVIGLVYGYLTTAKQPKKKMVVYDLDNLTKKLIDTVKEFFLKRNILNPTENPLFLDDEMIKTETDDQTCTKGSIKCPLCSKIYQVFLKQSKTSFSWVISNFSRHFITCSLRDQNHSSDVLVNDPVQNSIVTNLVIEVVNPETTDQQSELTTYSEILTTQLFSQNIRLVNSTIKNNEATKVFIIGSGEQINIIEMPKDGNCLFKAIAHQLNYVSNGSNEHDMLSFKLRNDCVEHIKNNIEQYQREIAERIYHTHPDKKMVSIEDCTSYVNNNLSKPGTWGGAEVLKAVTLIFNTNILVLSEKGSVYFGYNFNPKYDRTIMLAYRLADSSVEDLSNYSWNHYDSIAKAEKEVITTYVPHLIQNMLKSKSLNSLDVITIE